MIRTILASAATISLLAGVAAAQEYVPSAAGLTPGAPLASDPRTDDALIAGETLPGERPVMAAPVIAEPDFRGVAVERTPALIPNVEMTDRDQYVPSPNGLTPGAPLGSDENDNKVVAGQGR